LEQATSKNKSLRAAALQALASHDKPVVTQLFTELIKGKSLELLAKPFRLFRSRQVLKALLEEGSRVLDLLLKNDPEPLQRFSEILDCLEQRKEPEVCEFLLDALQHCEKLGRLKGAAGSQIGGWDVVDRVTALLYATGTAEAFEGVLAKRDVLPLMSFPQVVHSALRAWSPEKVYEEFSPLLAHKKGAGADKSEVVQRAVLASTWDPRSRFQASEYMEAAISEMEALRSAKWDPRWLDAAIKSGHDDIVCALAKPGDKGAVNYLLKVLASKREFHSGQIITALARCQYPKVSEVFVDLVKRKTKQAHYLDYDAMLLFECARHLPAADLPRLEAAVVDLKDDFTSPYLEALAPLRPAATQP